MIVDELEEAGVVRREPDPEDGRAKQIVYTAAGMRAFDKGRTAIAEIERRWKREVGAARWNDLREALGELASERP
jgi:DNA-binding MarR family transcriptional regulator